MHIASRDFHVFLGIICKSQCKLSVILVKQRTSANYIFVLGKKTNQRKLEMSFFRFVHVWLVVLVVVTNCTWKSYSPEKEGEILCSNLFICVGVRCLSIGVVSLGGIKINSCSQDEIVLNHQNRNKYRHKLLHSK